MRSAQSHVQVEHDDDPGDGAQGGQALVALAVGLGHDLVADHVEHGPGREAPGIGQDGSDEVNGPGPEEG